MGFEVYYPPDIRNAPPAAEQATGAASQVVGAEGYNAGYLAAPTTTARF